MFNYASKLPYPQFILQLALGYGNITASKTNKTYFYNILDNVWTEGEMFKLDGWWCRVSGF